MKYLRSSSSPGELVGGGRPSSAQHVDSSSSVGRCGPSPTSSHRRDGASRFFGLDGRRRRRVQHSKQLGDDRDDGGPVSNVEQFVLGVFAPATVRPPPSACPRVLPFLYHCFQSSKISDPSPNFPSCALSFPSFLPPVLPMSFPALFPFMRLSAWLIG